MKILLMKGPAGTSLERVLFSHIFFRKDDKQICELDESQRIIKYYYTSGCSLKDKGEINYG